MDQTTLFTISPTSSSTNTPVQHTTDSLATTLSSHFDIQTPDQTFWTQNLTRHEVERDGDCFFSAVNHSMKMIRNEWTFSNESLRNASMVRLKKSFYDNPVRYVHHHPDASNPPNFEDPNAVDNLWNIIRNKYRSKKKDFEDYVDYDIINATMWVLKINIRIHGESRWFFKVDGRTADHTIHLLDCGVTDSGGYCGIHYDALVPISRATDTSAILGPVKNFVSIIFSHRDIPRSPHHNFINQTNIDFNVRSIINRPEVTMAHNLIGFDKAAAVDLIMTVARAPLCERSKPVIAVVRGIGGGKTRVLSELRNEFMGRKGTLVIAITYNCGMDLEVDELSVSDNVHVSVILTVVTHIISTVYDVDVSDVFKAINTSLLPDQDKKRAVEILREVLMRVVTDVRKHREVDTVILLVDETARVEEVIAEKDLGSPENCTSSLREALLNPCSLFDFDIALVLSSLTITPVGKSTSGRAVKPLVLPGHLDPEKIVNDWWGCSWRSEEDKYKLLRLAMAINNLPRLVEYAGWYVKSHHGSIDKIYMANLINVLHSALDSQYHMCFFPSSEVLQNIIFGTYTVFNSEILQCIKYSLVTNSLSRFSNTSRLKLDASIFALGVSAIAMEGRGHSSFIAEAYTKIIQTLGSVQDGGYNLEEYFWIWLKVRIMSAQGQSSRFPLTLGRLLGYSAENETYGYKPEVQSVLNEEFKNMKNYDFNKLFKGRLTYSSYDSDRNAFVKEIEMMNEYEFRLSKEKDAFDGVLKFPTAKGEVYYIFWDNMCPISSKNKGDRKQYKRIQKIMRAIMKKDKENITKFLYIYYTICDKKSNSSDNDLLNIYSDIASSFFGPIWELFKCSRKSLNS